MSTLLHQSINDSVSTNSRTGTHDRPTQDRPTTLTVTTDEATSVTGAQNRSCPRCHAAIDRVRRRPIDRFISMFRLVHRYRCSAFVCKWEGNLPAHGKTAKRTP